MTPMTNDQKAAQKAANVASRVAGSSRRKLVTVLSLDNPKRATKATARPDPDCHLGGNEVGKYGRAVALLRISTEQRSRAPAT